MTGMSLMARLTEDMKQAMKDKEAGKFRLGVIRMARSSIKNAENNERRELTDDEILTILSKEVKMRRDAASEFEKAGRMDLASGVEAEAAILLSYLPEQLSAAEVEAIVRQAVEQAQATSVREMGKVMALVMPQVKGRADGKLVNEMVRKALGA